MELGEENVAQFTYLLGYLSTPPWPRAGFPSQQEQGPPSIREGDHKSQYLLFPPQQCRHRPRLGQRHTPYGDFVPGIIFLKKQMWETVFFQEWHADCTGAAR